MASFYGFDASRDEYIQSRKWQKAYARLFAEIDAAVVEGPHMATRVQRLGCAAGKINVIRLPADEEALRHIRRPRSESFRVCVAGRFVEKKGFDTGIRAFSSALKGKDARLTVLGGGPLESEYRTISRVEGIDRQTDFAGRLPFAEFMGEIAACDVALFPSRTAGDGDSEGGAPVTLIEAQWLGVPAIVSTHDDLPFIVAPAGALVLSDGSVESWASALRSLYENRPRLERMSAAASAYAREHHSIEQNVRAREALYEALGT